MIAKDKEVFLLRVLKEICDRVIESARAAGTLGVSERHVFAVLASQGCSMTQWQTIRDSLVATKQIIYKNGLLFAVTADT